MHPIVTELFIRGKKLNISIVFITQSYFKVPNNVRLNFTHFFHSSDIDFKDFIKFYKKYTVEPYSFLVNDATLPLHNSLRQKNLLK